MKLVTVCTDSPANIKRGHPDHGLKATMLSDPELEVTDQFGLRNQKIQTGPPRRPGRPQPVPTSILAGADGVVRWMDQSENYQRRSAPEVVLGALTEHLG